MQKQLQQPSDHQTDRATAVRQGGHITSLQRMADASPQVRQLQALQAMANNAAAPVQRVWNGAPGSYFTAEKCTLRADDRNHTALRTLAANSDISVDPDRQLEFRLNILSHNHVWVRHGSDEGWIRDNAIGQADGRAVPGHAGKIRGYVEGRARALRPPEGKSGGSAGLLARQFDPGQLTTRVRQLLNGVDERQPALVVVKRIMANMLLQGFKYTAANTTSDTNYLSGVNSGDCRTLSTAIAKLAEILGVPGITVESHEQRFTTGHRKPTLTGTLPAGHGNWTFDNHYWLNVSGLQYDVLFDSVLDRSGWAPA